MIDFLNFAINIRFILSKADAFGWTIWASSWWYAWACNLPFNWWAPWWVLPRPINVLHEITLIIKFMRNTPMNCHWAFYLPKVAWNFNAYIVQMLYPSSTLVHTNLFKVPFEHTFQSRIKPNLPCLPLIDFPCSSPAEWVKSLVFAFRSVHVPFASSLSSPGIFLRALGLQTRSKLELPELGFIWLFSDQWAQPREAR